MKTNQIETLRLCEVGEQPAAYAAMASSSSPARPAIPTTVAAAARNS
jgi:hypothetical protein